ncbi:hypothetical protein [Shimazuella kribbensis]|uniref:hypothetical protein n=1 Tax=Shimazuella kribbensis TaxID=139808 RepID=UPI00048D4218|nr:hypothetical protein [Shimazuella kribbensis]
MSEKKARKSMTLQEFVRQQLNSNWGHFTDAENAIKDDKDENLFAFCVLEGTDHSEDLKLVRETTSKDGKRHLWYDARDIKVGESYWKKTQNGAVLEYRRVADDRIVLYV